MKRSWYLSVMLFVLIIGISICFLTTGAASLSFNDLVHLVGVLYHGHLNQLTLLDEIIIYIKLPLLFSAFLVGVMFGFSGGLMQGLLRNPLADPGVLGISSGASLMVVLGLWFFSVPLVSNLNQNFVILLLAGLGSSGVLVLMYLVSYLLINGKLVGVLLAGVALASIFSAVLMLVMIFSNQSNLNFALSWLMGGIHTLPWTLLAFDSILMFLTLLLLISVAPQLDLLSLGEVDAIASGVNVKQLLLITLLGLSVLTALSVSIAGPVAFIGLLAPHLVRLFGIRRHRALLYLSALVGGLLVVMAETIANNLFSPYVLPLGAITALFGAPFFLFLLWRARKINLFV